MNEAHVQQIIDFLDGVEVCVLPWKELIDCLREEKDSKQVASLKKFGAALKKAHCDSIPPAEKDMCIDILTKTLVAVDPKKMLHKAIASILQSFPDKDRKILPAKIASALCSPLSSCPRTDARECRLCVDAVSGLLGNFPLGQESLLSVFDKVFCYLQEVLLVFMDSASCIRDSVSQNEAMYNCLAAVQTIMLVIQKCSQDRRFVDDVGHIQGLLEALLQTMWTILSNDAFLADCRSAAGLALVLLLRTLVTLDGHQLSRMIYLTLFHHLSGTNPGPPSLGFHIDPFDTASLPGQSYLFVCHGVLAMLDPADLMDGWLPLDGQCLLIHVLFPEILHLTERLTEPSSALSASRTLTLWTSAAVVAMTSGIRGDSEVALFEGSAEIPQKLIQYVWTNWDHPIDGIRYQTRNIFENILQLHVIAQAVTDYEPEKDAFLLGLLDSLAAVSQHVRGKYTTLACLVPHLGAQRILGLYPTMPRELLGMFGDQTMVPYACDLLERLFTDHKAFLTKTGSETSALEPWQSTWIIPFLESLCSSSTSKEQKTYLAEYFIPKLLKCSPESCAFIIKHLHRDDQGTSSSLDQPGQLGALVTCLKTARAMGLIKNEEKRNGDDDASQEACLWKGLVPYVKLQEALCHKESQVRIDALGLLCQCNRTTEVITRKELALLRFFLKLNINSPSPSFRQKMGAHLKKLLFRLRESGRVCLRQMTRKHHKEDKADIDSRDSSDGRIIETYKGFMSWLIGLLFDALEPGSSYPRRTLSLTTLKVVAQIFDSKTQDSNKSSFFDMEAVWTPDHVQLLLHRLTDSYETNKVMAFDLLCDLSQQTLGFMNQDYLHRLYGDAMVLASSNKPHNCETASFMLRLLAQQLSRPLKGDRADLPQSILGILTDLCSGLAEEVGVAKGSLLEAAVQGPMYGLLHCIRELLTDVDLRSVSADERWECMVRSLIELCLDVADAASPVVCNSSPEGYIPEETDADVNDADPSSDQEGAPSGVASTRTQKVTPQMVLVCCWRSMKEVSLLMGQLALTAPLRPDKISAGLVTKERLEAIGQFILKLLKESRHRGAFELAYAGFIMLATRLWKSDVVALHQLPQHWLQGLLTDITASQSILCATRRSAGIPFAIQALISSEPDTRGKTCFKQTMDTLLGLAFPVSPSDEAITSQVHALNVLRVLYKDTHLGEDVIPYIADGVRVSILGFAAQLWAVRNSSTLLFSALVTRIFGVQRAKQEHDRRNCMTGKEFFARFPTLHPFLLTQLKDATSLNARSGVVSLHPSLFPVLLLLSRLYPSPMDGAHTQLSMDLFVPYVLRCASSAVFKTRAIAARALVPLVPANRQVHMLAHLIGLLPKTPDAPSQHNCVHGVLLQIYELLDCILLASSSINSSLHSALSNTLSSLKDYMWLASKDNDCFVTRAAFLTILDEWLFKSSVRHLEGALHDLQRDVVFMAIAAIQSVSSRTDSSFRKPGYVMLQTACAGLCIKRIFLQEDGETDSSSATTKDEGDEKESVGISSGRQTARLSTAGENQISKPRPALGGLDGDGRPAPSLEAILIELLSSPIYEVRLLTLDDLIQSSQRCSSDQTKSNHPWTTMVSSSHLFQKLVAMVTDENQLACLVKVYELLSYHPMTGHFPWQLPEHQVSCTEIFKASMDVTSQPKQREDLICSIVKFTSSLVTVSYSELSTADCDTAKVVHKLLSDWSVLLDQCSTADQTVHSRLTVVYVIAKLAAILLTDQSTCLGDIPFLLWGVVMRLLQDDDPEVQQGAVSCIRNVALEVTHPDVSDLCRLDTQPSLGLHLGVHLFVALFIQRQPGNCLRNLLEWAAGSVEDASPGDCEETQDERLFDQGEANTSFEGVSMAKIVSKQLRSLARTLQLELLTSSGGQSATKPELTRETWSEKAAGEAPSQPDGLTSSAKKTSDNTVAVSESESSADSSGIAGQSCASLDGQKFTVGPPVATLEQDSNPGISQMLATDEDFLERDEIVNTGTFSRRGLSARDFQQLQIAARESLMDLASRLEEHLNVDPATSSYLNASEWEAQCIDCCRILLCCGALTGLLPQDAEASLAARLSPSLEEARRRFCQDAESGSGSPLIQEAVQSLDKWCATWKESRKL